MFDEQGEPPNVRQYSLEHGWINIEGPSGRKRAGVGSVVAGCALDIVSKLDVCFGSWLCENSSARRARRNISKKLRIMESNRAARTMFNTLSENCIFYISQLYEFSHRLGHPRLRRSNLQHGARPLRPQKR